MPTATLHRRPARATPPLTPVRRRVALGWAALVVLLLAVTLVAGLIFAFSDPHPTTLGPAQNVVTPARTTPALTDQQHEDLLAAAPMPSLPAAAANPHALLPHSTVEPLIVPSSTATRGLVPSGFPQTPGGAVAQLAAIDETALAGMNPSQVAQVYRDWAVPEAEPIALWSVQQFVQQTLNASGIPDGSSQLQASYAVTEGQVKGTVDDDFVLACINGEFDASLLDNIVRTGAADCARMVWTGERWQIGAGTQPATPPNAWPGTAESAQAGWRSLAHD